MKRIIGFLMALAFLAVAPGSLLSADQIVLKLGHSTAPGGMLDKRAQKFAELASAKTNGKVKIEIYPAGQLGHIKEILQGVSFGTIDMAQESEQFMDAFEKDYTIITTAFLFSRSELQNLQLIDELRERVRKKAGIRTLSGLAFRPAFHLWTQKRPVTTPDQLKGMKIRVWQSKGVVDVWNGLGAAATVIPWQETYLALAQKVVDGMVHNIVQIRDEKFFEQLDFCIRLNAAELFDATWINENKFSSLPPDVQKALNEASKESADWLTNFGSGLEGEAVKQIQGKITFIDGDRAIWVKKASEVAKKLEDGGLWSKGLLEKIGKK